MSFRPQRSGVEKSSASLYNVIIRRLKIPRIPRISNVAMLSGIIHHKGNFMLGVFAKKPFQISQIVLIHCDDEIVIIIILFRDLSCLAITVFYAFLKQNPSRRRIKVVPNLLGRCRRRCNLKFLCPSGLLNHIFQNILRHRAPADVTVTDKKNAMIFHDENFNAKVRKIY